MAHDFNLQKFLIENKMTHNSRLLSENDPEYKIEPGPGYRTKVILGRIKTILDKIEDVEGKINNYHGTNYWTSVTDNGEKLDNINEKYYNELISYLKKLELEIP
jgi:hypothetical protein